MSTPVQCDAIYTDPRRWFATFNRNRDGQLTTSECATGLVATFPTLNESSARGLLEALWPLFDTDNSGSLSMDEFVKGGGLCDTIVAQFPVGQELSQLRPAMSSSSVKPPACASSYPTHASDIIYTDPRRWFTTFNRNRDGQLTTSECATGLVATFPTLNESSASSLLEALWPLFDTDNSGSLSMDEFVKGGGLCNTIVAQFPAPQPSPIHNTTIASNSHFPPPPPPPHGRISVPDDQLPIPPLPSSAARQAKRRALLVGINYTGTTSQLRGCVNDVDNIRRLLTETYGWQGSSEGSYDGTVSTEIKVLTDDGATQRPTKENILSHMRWLARDARRGDVLFFMFSGHGTQQPDREGLEEDGMNECIVPVDYQSSGLISDDEISSIVIQPLPEGVRLTAVMDCCHSGTGLDLPFEWQPLGAGAGAGAGAGPSGPAGTGPGWPGPGAWVEETNPLYCPADVQLFSGCEDEGTSCDVGGGFRSAPGGALTTAFCEALRRNPCPTYIELISALNRIMRERGFKQRPQLTSTQRFDCDRPFLLEDVVPNSNERLGRVVRRRFASSPRQSSDPDLQRIIESIAMLAASLG